MAAASSQQAAASSKSTEITGDYRQAPDVQGDDLAGRARGVIAAQEKAMAACLSVRPTNKASVGDVSVCLSVFSFLAGESLDKVMPGRQLHKEWRFDER